MARPKGSKNKPKDEPMPEIVPAVEPAVVYLGDAPAYFRGHYFIPGAPITGLPADVVDTARRKPIFRVLE